ncbi:kynureninase [uncultured Jatrophihabitans sp.]|uniref:kynureninase n=1 Tax=uncultured Jatrophihabitans sp. TaxID=1610747 RepID=UPI0035CBDF95
MSASSASPITSQITCRADAVAADDADPLGYLRARFALPESVIYLDGNSLGALPVGVAAAVEDTVAREWGQDLIASWNGNGWWTLPARVGDRIGALIGAAPGQVMCGDSTSVQLFQALVALARLRPDRRVIVTDGANFPTDQYLAESVAALLGLRLIRVSPAELPAALTQDVAVVAYSAVDYRTGELWDTAAITAAVHAAGATMLWDLAHAAGVVAIELDAIGADAAVGCSYKYLNGGPGAPGWIYLAARHQPAARLPLTGWQGAAAPFDLQTSYAPAAGVERARIGTPPVLSMRALDAALDLYDGVPLAEIRAKSLALTSMVISYADALGVPVATPRDPARRGSQVALRVPFAYELTQALIARGVVGDYRAPDLVRLGLTPLSLSFVEVWDAMGVLRAVLEAEEWRAPQFARAATAVVT